MPKVNPETKYKRFLRARYPGWSEAYEPSMGSGTGYPDIQVLSPKKRLLPIELKVGYLKGDRVYPHEVRGDQVVWAHNFHRAGGTSVMFIGVETAPDSGKYDTYIVPGHMMIDWRAGYHDHIIVLWGTDPRDLVHNVQLILGEIEHQGLVFGPHPAIIRSETRSLL